MSTKTSATTWNRFKPFLNKTFSEREINMVELQCYGKTLQEIGDTVGVSKERARQILAKADRKLRFRAVILNDHMDEVAEYMLLLRDLRAKNTTFREEMDKVKSEAGMDYIREHGLATRTVNALRRVGIQTMDDLRMYFATHERMNIRNIGEKTERILRGLVK